MVKGLARRPATSPQEAGLCMGAQSSSAPPAYPAAMAAGALLLPPLLLAPLLLAPLLLAPLLPLLPGKGGGCGRTQACNRRRPASRRHASSRHGAHLL